MDPHRDRAAGRRARMPSCSGTWNGCSATCGWRWRTGPGCRPRPCSWPSSWPWSADGRITDGADASGVESPAEVEALLRWLADGHFTFLGYREYDLEDGPDGMALRAVAGTGLGILRHDRAGLERVRGAAPGGAGPGPGPAAADPDQGELPLDRAPAQLPRLRGRQAAGPRTGKVAGEYRFLGLYTHDAYTESITRIPVLRRKLTDVLAAIGRRRRQPRRQGRRRVPGELPARGAVPDPGGASWSRSPQGVLRLRERRQTRLFLRKDIYGRYMSCLVYLPRDRYTTQVRLRTQEILRQALHGAAVDYSVLVGESPVARLHIVVRAERGQVAARRGRRRAGGPGGRRGPVLGRRPGRGGGAPARRGAGARAARHVQRRGRSRRPTRPTSRPASRSTTWKRS